MPQMKFVIQLRSPLLMPVPFLRGCRRVRSGRRRIAVPLSSRAPFSRSYSSTEITITTPRPCFSIRTGSARAVSIISPKAFFASRADMVFMANSRGDPCAI